MTASSSSCAPATGRTVLVAGATGLVGRHLLDALLADPGVAAVHVLSRRPLERDDPRLQVHRADVHRPGPLPAVDEVYLALGTTLKVAGSREAFRALDLEANLAIARAAQAAGARRLGLVSAAGADARSPVFYNRVKGELEQALAELPWQALVIARPSLLLGDRAALHQPVRWAERAAQPLARLLAPLLPGRLRPVAAQAVARGLARALPQARGVQVLPSDVLARG